MQGTKGTAQQKKQEVGRYYIWILFAPAYRTGGPTATFFNKYYDPNKAQYEYKRLLKHARKRISEGIIWQAKIYHHPGNTLEFQYHNLTGEKHRNGGTE